MGVLFEKGRHPLAVVDEGVAQRARNEEQDYERPVDVVEGVGAVEEEVVEGLVHLLNEMGCEVRHEEVVPTVGRTAERLKAHRAEGEHQPDDRGHLRLLLDQRHAPQLDQISKRPDVRRYLRVPEGVLDIPRRQVVELE